MLCDYSVYATMMRVCVLCVVRSHQAQSMERLRLCFGVLYTHAYIHAHTRTYIHTHTHTHTHTISYIHLYSHIYTISLTRTFSLFSFFNPMGLTLSDTVCFLVVFFPVTTMNDKGQGQANLSYSYTLTLVEVYKSCSSE
jgi:hypothetical protein